METFEVLIFWQGFNLNCKTFKKKKKDPESKKYSEWFYSPLKYKHNAWKNFHCLCFLWKEVKKTHIRLPHFSPTLLNSQQGKGQKMCRKRNHFSPRKQIAQISLLLLLHDHKVHGKKMLEFTTHWCKLCFIVEIFFFRGGKCQIKNQEFSHDLFLNRNVCFVSVCKSALLCFFILSLETRNLF